jgi:uncharacterized damage-inducible protein DinB
MTMTFAEQTLPEFDQEMASTRKVLERAPEEKYDWRAHPKSNTLGWNVSHLVEIPGWVEGTLIADSWDISPPGGEPYKAPNFKTRQEVLAEFDRNVSAARKAIAAARDEEMPKMWSLLQGGKTILTMPKAAVIRNFVLNHIIHHRAITTVYLRLNDIPVPGMYGPSGDE